jgi:uncharacterized protein YbjT (DUF2867 family)
VGGRLLRSLETGGRRVRCLARRPEFVRAFAAPETEVFGGDVRDPLALQASLAGVTDAYYLVHSLSAGKAFEAEDRKAASGLAEAARREGVRRIIYLGGLGRATPDLSPHLRSRHEVGELLRSTGVPVIEFRASIIIGSGSLSFEIIRALVERLPVMVAPRWVATEAQPIGIEDIVAYLVHALDIPAENRIYEIGGADHTSYGGIMREYARQRGLRRRIVPVPVLSPRLSSLWLALVTPVHAAVGRTLVDGLRNPTLVDDDAALRDFPIRPMSLEIAVHRALHQEDAPIPTRWSDAISSGRGMKSWAGVRFGSRIVDSRVESVDLPPASAFAPIRRIGGATGWYYADRLWRLRGAIDMILGGVGSRRGRRDPEDLRIGDALDFWRVEAYESDRLLRLVAEMRLPGRAWLVFEAAQDGERTVLRQTAVFDPIGLGGILYWYALFPIHALIFRGMLRRIARSATEGAAT